MATHTKTHELAITARNTAWLGRDKGGIW